MPQSWEVNCERNVGIVSFASHPTWLMSVSVDNVGFVPVNNSPGKKNVRIFETI